MDNPQNNNKSNSLVILIVIVVIAIAVVAFIFFGSGNQSQIGSDLDVGVGVSESISSEDLSDEEREEIVQAILTTDSIIRSGDVQAIRDHISNVDPEGISQITDEQILEISELYAQFAGEVTAEDFYAESAVWEVGEDRAVITFEKDGEPRIFEAAKIGGVWY